MRDMSQVLERWAGWAKSGSGSGVVAGTPDPDIPSHSCAGTPFGHLCSPSAAGCCAGKAAESDS